MSLHLQPVQIATDSNDTKSHLVFADGFLVAVLVQLSDEFEDEAGWWFLEAAFGRVNDFRAPTFPNLEEAQDWITRQLTS